MNTNIMTLCNLITQQQGSGIVQLKTKSLDAQQQTEIIPQQSAGDTPTIIRPVKKDEPAFDKALHEKIGIDNRVQPQCPKQLKDKEPAADPQILVFPYVAQSDLIIHKSENLPVHLQPLSKDCPAPAESLSIEPDVRSFNLPVEAAIGTHPDNIVKAVKPVKPTETLLSSSPLESKGQDLDVSSDNISPEPLSDLPAVYESTENTNVFVSPSAQQPHSKTEPVTNADTNSRFQPDPIANPQSSTQPQQQPQLAADGDLSDNKENFGKTTSKLENISPVRPSNELKPEHLAAKFEKPLPHNVHVSKQEPSLPLEKTAPVIEDNTQEVTKLEVLPEQKIDQPQVLSARASIHRMNIQAATAENLGIQKNLFSSGNKDVTAINEDTSNPIQDVAAPVASDKPQVTADFTKNNTNPGQLSMGRQIEQTVTTFYRPGTQQIIIRLDPPDLGPVTIKFIEHKDGLTGILHVDKPETRNEIQQALAGIVQNLQNSEVNIRRLEVVLNNQQQPAAQDQSGYQSGGFEHQNTPNQGSFGNNINYNDWLSDPQSTSGAMPQQQTLSEKSINMLI